MRLLICLAICSSLLAAESLSDWRLEATIPLAATLHHVQGIDVRDGRLWVSSVDAPQRRGWLSLFELETGKLIRQTQVQDGARFHPGGISLDGDFVWVPVAEYRPLSSSVIQKRRRETLELVSQFAVSDHIGCLAVTPTGLLGGNWDARFLYTWDASGAELAKRPNPGKTAYQDLKAAGGTLVASGNVSREQGAIEWFSLPELRLVKRIVTGKTSRGVLFTNEGMAVAGELLYLLPEDDPARLFVFSRK